MFEKLDVYLQQKTQKVIDRIHDVFGVTKFRLAIWLIISAAVSLNLFCIIERFFDLWDIVINLLFVFVAFLYCLLAEHDEREFLRTNKLQISLASTIPAWNRVLWIAMFLSSCIIVLLSNSSSFISIWLLFTTLWLYVDLCVPRRPNKSKVRKWIDGMLTSLGEMLEPTRQLVPIRTPQR